MGDANPLHVQVALCLGAVLAFAGCRADARFEAPVASTSGKSDLVVETARDSSVLTIGDAAIELRIPDGPMALSRDEIARWVAESARAVAQYYGRFPARRTIVELTRTESRRVDGGSTVGLAGAVVIRVQLGARADAFDLARDWVMTHEMVHTALPDLPEKHLWLEEGLATYVEPIARAQAGLESAEDVWLQLVRGLPLGLPEDGDRGLDRTPTWGRTYWGGALFCLLADVEIRERTDNRAGLQDALRAIVATDRSSSAHWPIERVLSEANAAVGTPVLSDLYARHATRPESVDLVELWERLGIRTHRGRILFDDSAPLASIRRAISQVESSSTSASVTTAQ